jgi:hypothetical protein
MEMPGRVFLVGLDWHVVVVHGSTNRRIPCVEGLPRSTQGTGLIPAPRRAHDKSLIAPDTQGTAQQRTPGDPSSGTALNPTFQISPGGNDMNGTLLTSLIQDSNGSTSRFLESDEIPVKDIRSNTSPRQFVEQKLIEILSGSPLMVSQFQRRLKPGVH